MVRTVKSDGRPLHFGYLRYCDCDIFVGTALRLPLTAGSWPDTALPQVLLIGLLLKNYLNVYFAFEEGKGFYVHVPALLILKTRKCCLVVVFPFLFFLVAFLVAYLLILHGQVKCFLSHQPLQHVLSRALVAVPGL